MSDFHDDPTLESATPNVNADNVVWNTPYTPIESDTFERSPLQPPRSAHTPHARRPLRRWLVVGGLLAALGIGAVAGGALAVAHANGAGTTNSTVATATPAQGKGHHAPGRFGMRAALTVTSVSGQTITATRPNGKKVTILTTSSTVYSRAGQTVSASAVKSGEHIRVRGTRNGDGSITATRVDIALPGYAGVVTAVKGSTITVQTRSGTHIIDVNASTRYYQGRGHTAQSGSLSGIKVGDRLVAAGTLNSDGSLNAQVVYFGPARSVAPSTGATPATQPGGSAPAAPAGL